MTRAQELTHKFYLAMSQSRPNESDMLPGEAAALTAGLDVLCYGLEMLDSIAQSLERIAGAHKSPTSDPMAGADQSVTL